MSFWLHGCCGEWEDGPVNHVNHTSWVAVVTPTDRPKSVRNCCLIELFCGVVCVVTLPFWHFCWCRGFCHRTGSDLLFVFLKKCIKETKWTSNFNFQLNMLMHVRGKCRKWMDGRRARRTQNYDTRTWSIEHYTKSCVKFQLNMSKHVGEKCRKLCITSMLA